MDSKSLSRGLWVRIPTRGTVCQSRAARSHVPRHPDHRAGRCAMPGETATEVALRSASRRTILTWRRRCADGRGRRGGLSTRRVRAATAPPRRGAYCELPRVVPRRRPHRLSGRRAAARLPRRLPAPECEAVGSSARPPGYAVQRVRSQGCTYVQSWWKHWPCVFPQHGAGRKHERPIVLEPWQRELVEQHPGRFLRGLFHSDGCRITNWATKQARGRHRRPVRGIPALLLQQPVRRHHRPVHVGPRPAGCQVDAPERRPGLGRAT